MTERTETTLYTVRLGRALLGFQRASDGRWEKDGKLIPRLAILRWPNGEGGRELIVGPWAIGLIWKRRQECHQ
jgi:hypothetical protein